MTTKLIWAAGGLALGGLLVTQVRSLQPAAYEADLLQNQLRQKERQIADLQAQAKAEHDKLDSKTLYAGSLEEEVARLNDRVALLNNDLNEKLRLETPQPPVDEVTLLSKDTSNLPFEQTDQIFISIKQQRTQSGQRMTGRQERALKQYLGLEKARPQRDAGPSDGTPSAEPGPPHPQADPPPAAEPSVPQ